ncbi:MAG TPA: hypothetical protein VGM80_04205 [Gaiellaceae bacterium]|jgi:hypothetical protein
MRSRFKLLRRSRRGEVYPDESRAAARARERIVLPRGPSTALIVR